MELIQMCLHTLLHAIQWLLYSGKLCILTIFDF